MTRVLVHTQHLSGVGHHVRMDLLARALAPRHDVWMLDGGAPVPRPPLPAGISLVAVPRVRRVDGALAALAADGRADDLGAVLAARRRLLEQTVAEIRPDVLVIEHFPFSKWELADEILSTIVTARAARPGVRVVCSVRDIVAPTRFASPEDGARTAPTLNAHFDALLVHGDPRLVRLEDSFPFVAAIDVPIVYTGIVSERLPAAATPREPELRVVGSVGGGSEGVALARNVVRAFAAVRRARPDARLTLFTGLFFPSEATAALRTEAEETAVRVEPFSTDFVAALAGADVSVSRAGYNTCANVLESAVRCVLVPSTARSDQGLRAARLARVGLARVLDADPPAPDAIAEAVLAAAEDARLRPDVDLDGATRAAAVIADLGRRGRAAPRPLPAVSPGSGASRSAPDLARSR